MHSVIPFLVQKQVDIRFVDCLIKGVVEVGSWIKGTSLYQAKWETDSITFPFIATWTIKFPTYGMTYTSKMESHLISCQLLSNTP